MSIEQSINKALNQVISIADAVEMVVALEKGHLPGQMKNVTSVV